MDPFLKGILIACAFIFILYKYGTRRFGYWRKKGVREMKPVPFLGDSYKMTLMMGDALEVTQDFYNNFKNERFGGIYILQNPFLVVTNPDILKQIMVKDAEHFHNRYNWFQNSDPLLGKNLFLLNGNVLPTHPPGGLQATLAFILPFVAGGEKWKSMRNVMTTVFTSAKMKDMFRFMNECSEQSTRFMQAKASEKGENALEVDIKDFFSRYGTDVIASTAFGLQVDSLNNPKNEFFASGEIVRNVFLGTRFMLFFLFPGLMKKLNMTLFGEKYNKFFTSLISDTIRHREEKKIIRKDVIHILMEARKGKAVGEDGEYVKGKLPDLTDVDIAAQGIVFFIGGFETIASLLGFVAYELAVNPDVQETLQREIDEVIESENGVTYEGVIHSMKYLDMVLNETLRKWPPAGFTDRVVTRKYTIPKTDSSPEVTLDVGDKVFIPISGFHYDPEYFPDPHKFDPERFRDEKNSIKPFTYLPFGEGLRHCIGMRYAMMEAKTILVHVLKNFTIVPTKKTRIPLELSKGSPFQLQPVGGFWMGLQPRTH